MTYAIETAAGTRKRHLGALLMCTTALTVLSAESALAQDEQNAKGPEEIVVTAQRREQSIQDVPYNISAISGDAIERAKVLDSIELLRSVPGVSVVDRGPRNAAVVNSVKIRGINVDGNALGDYAVSAVSTVSTYIDETPIFANFMIKDVERVEVLRGPQGTLYGSGSLGGTVRFITRDPVLGEYEGRVGATGTKVNGSGDLGYAGDGMVNIPLGEYAALRLVASVADYPGITDYRNLYVLDANGIPVAPSGVLSSDAQYYEKEDADTVEQWFGRATLLVEPNEIFDLKLSFNIQSDEYGGRRQQTLGSDGFGVPYDEYENGSIQLEPASRDVNMTSLEMNIDLGFATLTSASSFYDHEGDSTSENTGFYAQAGFLAFYYNYPRPMASAVRTYSDEAFVQELRLTSNTEGAFDYIVGAFYMDQTLSSTQDSYLRGFKQWWDTLLPGLAALVTGDQDFDYARDESFTDLALFGELTFNVSDTFRLTGGVRWFDNESKNTTYFDLPLYTGVFTPEITNFKTTDSKTLFKANASWDVTDQDMAYATFSQGYRRGGTNAVPTSGTFAEDPRWQTYDADTVDNYELGIKGTRSGLLYNADIFYVDWSDPQLNTSSTNWGFYTVQNMGSAKTYGVELELDWRPTDAFHTSVGYSYVNAELTEDAYSPADPGGTPIALKGSKLPGAAEHLINAAADYTHPLPNDVDLFMRVDGYYQSETRNGVGTSPTFNVPLEAFQIWNASVSLIHNQADLTFFVKNIFNEEGVTGVFTEAYMGTAPALGYFGNGSKELISLPRTFGLAINYNF